MPTVKAWVVIEVNSRKLSWMLLLWSCLCLGCSAAIMQLMVGEGSFYVKTYVVDITVNY